MLARGREEQQVSSLFASVFVLCYYDRGTLCQFYFIHPPFPSTNRTFIRVTPLLFVLCVATRHCSRACHLANDMDKGRVYLVVTKPRSGALLPPSQKKVFLFLRTEKGKIFSSSSSSNKSIYWFSSYRRIHSWSRVLGLRFVFQFSRPQATTNQPPLASKNK